MSTSADREAKQFRHRSRNRVSQINGGHGESAGNRNAKYGSEPGVLFYTHLSDQYAPFYTKVINANVRDATHVLDGLLYHESQLRIEEHYRHRWVHRPGLRAPPHARV
jgi:TnpA family transposase